MTQEQSAAEDERTAEEQPEGGRPPLTREEDRRVVAGVCGGLGRHLDIDPVVFRVVTAVLCLTGGLGLFLYGLAWLIVPLEHPRGPPGRRPAEASTPAPNCSGCSPAGWTASRSARC